MADERQRCFWAGDGPAMIAYHDDEWGIPVRDELNEPAVREQYVVEYYSR